MVGPPAGRSSPMPNLGCKVSPCAECVVCGAQIGPVEPDIVALSMPRERLNIYTRCGV